MKALFLFVITLISFSSCSDKLSDEDLGGKARIQFRVNGLSYENDKKASVQNGSNRTDTIKKYYYLDEDYVIEASYAPDLGTNTKFGHSRLANTVAEKVTRPLDDGMFYRVLAFDKLTDELAADTIYKVGGSSVSNSFMELEPGREYIFVALCFNMIAAEFPNFNPDEPGVFVPMIRYQDANSPKLTGAKVVGVRYTYEGQEDLFDELELLQGHVPLSFYRVDNYGVLSSQNVNYLNIVFKQLYCYIKVNVDPGNTGYTVNKEHTDFYAPEVLYATNFNFSMIDGSILTYIPRAYWDFNLLPGKYYFYVNGETSFGSFETTLILSRNVGGVDTDEVRVLREDGLSFKNGLRYNINITIKNRNEVPVGYEIIRLTEEEGFDREEEVSW